MLVSGAPTILVTGGAGFVGSNLCERLLNEGFSVGCLDSFSTSSPDNIAHLHDYTGFKIITHDIIEPIFLDAQEIFNLACPASPRNYQLDPVHTMKTCVIGSINVLGMAKRNGSKILQASTSEVYGEPLIHPQSEQYWGNVNPTGVRSCYDEGKRAAETLFFDYHRRHNLQIKVARIFNTYGPRMHTEDGRVVSNFILQALKNSPITIYGDGTQTRCFCYVSDLVDGLLRLMRSGEGVTGPVNLGSSTEVNMLELAETVIRLTGSKSLISFRSRPADDPSRRRPDTSYAQQALSWRPKISLIEGLERTIEYFEQQLLHGAEEKGEVRQELQAS